MKISTRNLAQWLHAVVPPGVIIIAGAVFFRQAVLDSILSTPHPEIVYLIFAGFFVGLLLSWHTLFKLTREDLFFERWSHTPMPDRGALLQAQSRIPALAPVYELLVGNRHLPLRMRQAAMESELDEFDKRIANQLGLPGFMGGALIGLGLVGTFIGLLGTLQELSNVFTALLGAGGASSGAAAGVAAAPTDMFREMLVRLQAPMRGMGTAFVASLYGLLGSLLLGMVVMAVRKSGGLLLQRMRQSVREHNYGAGGSLLGLQSDNELAWNESERWSAMYQEMRDRNDAVISMLLKGQDEYRNALNGFGELNLAIRERNELDQVFSNLIADSNDLIGQTVKNHQTVVALMTSGEKERQHVIQQLGFLLQVMKERNSIDSVAHRIVSEGPHWIQAWDEIGAELRRLRGHAQESAAEHSSALAELLDELRRMNQAALRQDQNFTHDLARHNTLLAALQACRESFEDANARVRMHLAIAARGDAPAASAEFAFKETLRGHPTGGTSG
jgi:hypothetical protein